MDKSMGGILKYGIILFIITAVSAALLAGVNMLTKEQIAQNDVIAEQNALRKVIADATSFDTLPAETCEMYGAEAIYSAVDANNICIGHCIKISQNGYGGAVQSIIGIVHGENGEKIVSGVEVISHSETPGLGANLTKDSFKGQFVGKGKVEVVKAGAKEGQINAISGATISSKAMTASVNAALDIARNVSMLTDVADDENTGEEEAADE